MSSWTWVGSVGIVPHRKFGRCVDSINRVWQPFSNECIFGNKLDSFLIKADPRKSHHAFYDLKHDSYQIITRLKVYECDRSTPSKVLFSKFSSYYFSPQGIFWHNLSIVWSLNSAPCLFMNLINIWIFQFGSETPTQIYSYSVIEGVKKELAWISQ